MDKRGRLSRPVTLTPWANNIGIFASEITLPKGAAVEWILHFDGAGGGAWVVSDVAMLKRLTGNDHDPIYRYVTVDAADVEEESRP